MGIPRITFLLVCLLFATLVVRGGDFVLIVNKDLVPETLGKQDVKEILLGVRANWRDGSSIHIAVQEEGGIHDVVIKHFTRMTPYQFDRYWKRLVFAGNGVMPEIFHNDSEVLSFVARTPGAIGYVSSSCNTALVKVVSLP